MFAPPPAHVLHHLATPPRVSSWDRSTAASQIKLSAYVAHVERLLHDDLDRLAGHDIALALHVQAGVDASSGDLDNYLLPVAHRVGGHRLTAAFGLKGAHRAAVGVATAVRAPAPGAWAFARAVSGRSAETLTWRQEIDAQVRAQAPGPANDGPLELHVVFRVGPVRNWLNLWKPAIDSFGGIVGDGPRPFNPADHRIVWLGLHRQVDESRHHDVELQVWWRPSPFAAAADRPLR